MDESTLQTYSSPQYHMRKPTSRPKRVNISKKHGEKVNIWGGISWQGRIKFFVSILS